MFLFYGGEYLIYFIRLKYFFQIYNMVFLFLFQDKRLGALNRLKSKGCNILTCTDVASHGLDIRGVDVVINYDIPSPKV